ncbi:MAG: cyclic nucleotide-binding domain-containing protein [Elusimicrobiota bacterium]
MDDIVVFLKNHPYFSYLTETEQNEFASILSLDSFKKDEVIFKKGDLGDRLFIVKEGMVRIFIVDRDNEETIAIMKQGDVFGELSLYDTQPRSAYASALTQTTLLAITREKFDELKNKNPQIASKIFQIMLKIISKRLRLTTMKLFGQF